MNAEATASRASPQERRARIVGFLLFFLLFASYFMLRPVRETFGIAGGVDDLPYLWTGTFLAALVVVPLYGWLSKTVPRARLLLITYSFSAVVMTGFAFSLMADPDNLWVGRAFYIWVSVFNLFVISIAWSLMADVFNAEQARRIFAQIATGGTLGALAGPALSGLLVTTVSHAGLLLISTGLLLATLVCVRYLLAWRALHGRPGDAMPPTEPIGGGIWGGLTTIARSPWLLAISVFVLLLTSVTTFLYFEQARLVKETFPDRDTQTQVFASIDTVVQALTILVQVFVTGQLAKRLGVTVLLTFVPLVMVLGFSLLALAATFPVLVGVMIARRVGEYALVRPGREMLFTKVDSETKYKAKNAIDVMVYRGGDVASAWLNDALVAMGSSAVAAVGGALIALAWAGTGFGIGRRFDRDEVKSGPVPAPGG